MKGGGGDLPLRSLGISPLKKRIKPEIVAPPLSPCVMPRYCGGARDLHADVGDSGQSLTEPHPRVLEGDVTDLCRAHVCATPCRMLCSAILFFVGSIFVRARLVASLPNTRPVCIYQVSTLWASPHSRTPLQNQLLLSRRLPLSHKNRLQSQWPRT